MAQGSVPRRAFPRKSSLAGLCTLDVLRGRLGRRRSSQAVSALNGFIMPISWSSRPNEATVGHAPEGLWAPDVHNTDTCKHMGENLIQIDSLMTSIDQISKDPTKHTSTCPPTMLALIHPFCITIFYYIIYLILMIYFTLCKYNVFFLLKCKVK